MRLALTCSVLLLGGEPRGPPDRLPAGAGGTFVLRLPDRATVAPDRRGTPPQADPLG